MRVLLSQYNLIFNCVFALPDSLTLKLCHSAIICHTRYYFSTYSVGVPSEPSRLDRVQASDWTGSDDTYESWERLLPKTQTSTICKRPVNSDIVTRWGKWLENECYGLSMLGRGAVGAGGTHQSSEPMATNWYQRTEKMCREAGKTKKWLQIEHHNTWRQGTFGQPCSGDSAHVDVVFSCYIKWPKPSQVKN